MTPRGEPVVLVATGLALEARIARGRGVRALAGALDAHALAAALERELAQGACGVMSFGVAGGLAPGLAAGTTVLARGVRSGDAYLRCDEAWLARLAACLPGAMQTDVAGVDVPVADVAAKRALYARTGAAIVDTESHVASRVAHAHGAPFAVFRVVADPAHRSLPRAAAYAVDGRGGVRAGVVLRSLARSPSQAAPLLRAALDARAAFLALLRGRRRAGARLCCDARPLLFDVA